MSKIMGIDIGTATIGVALSDSLQIIASPLETIKYENKNKVEFIEKLLKLIEKYKPESIVYGLPLNMDGSPSTTTVYINEVIAIAKEKINLKFYPVDERWSSRESQKLIANANFKKTERKAKNDQVAASIILQTFLESQI